jgi:hypothetical protein
VFDENSFNFKLTVGGRAEGVSGSIPHSEVLIASATTKKDGMPIPLHCTWYNVTPREVNGKKQDEFVPIDSITGACYQPSVEDIGDRYASFDLTLKGSVCMPSQRVMLRSTKECLCSPRSAPSTWTPR